jgi:hypothetical protein
MDPKKIQQVRVRLFLVVFYFCSHSAAEVALQVPPDDQIYQVLKATLKGQGDLLRKKVKRLGNKTIELEVFISAEADTHAAANILANFERFPIWALRGINERPSGKSYHLKILGATWNKPLSILTVRVAFDLPFFHHRGEREFRVETISQKEIFTLKTQTLPAEDAMITFAQGLMKVFPAEGEKGRAWIYFKGQATLRYWLLYEAFPETMVGRETADRVQTLINNYQREEDAYRAALNSPVSKP